MSPRHSDLGTHPRAGMFPRGLSRWTGPLAVLGLVVAPSACDDGVVRPELEPLEALPPDLAAVVFTAEGRS
ncbi:MAG TPA: hypothetical protein VLL48_11965, partial [Longimicrobiales bacterium]|nr:hypothetical protein [Longimicrobiales bacterium]